MSAVMSVAAGRSTRADLDAMPDDGRRYELLDGTIVVSASPGGRHQRVVSRLLGVPLLAVEVLSPSSRRRDLGDKLTAYRDAGVPSCWVIDPLHPRVRAESLVDGEYVEIADVSGDEPWTASAPYAVTLRPADLTR